MSGNKERFTMSSSESGFGRCCSNCSKAREFRFRSASYDYSIRIGWSVRDDSPYVRRRDWRTTGKSFQKHKLYCATCGQLIVDERIRKQAIDIAFKYGNADNW